MKLPPHFTEGEKAILGCCLLDPSVVPDICETLEHKDFYSSEFRVIFKAVEQLCAKEAPIDWLSVSDLLKRSKYFDEKDASTILMELIDAVPSAANWRHYASKVKETAELRTLIIQAQEIVTACHKDQADPRDIRDLFQKRAFSGLGSTDSNDLCLIGDILQGVVKTLEDGKEAGFSTGLPSVDSMTGGFPKEGLVIVGGRPSMGKTAFAVTIARHVAARGMGVLFVSIEMSRDRIGGRFLSQKARVNLRTIYSGKLGDSEWGSVVDAVGDLSELPLIVYKCGTTTVPNIRAKARQAERMLSLPIGLIVVDYLQLMTDVSKEKDEVIRIGNITRDLKILSGDLGTCVKCLTQLNRGCDQRPLRPLKKHSRRPVKSDFRGSGRIEEDADLGIGMYRLEAYETELSPEELEQCRGVAEAVILKQRDGPTGIAPLIWIPETATFRSPVQNGVTNNFSEGM